ncbi:MAG: hypothetical protein H6825_08235 [Planctomycetes bacterium]|nr:hypothetical protein [Planctomycetota bacterium]
MKYLCLAYGDQEKMSKLTPEQFAALIDRCKLHDAEMRATGQYLEGISLEWGGPVIKAVGGKPVVTDGPFVESKEQVGGAVIIEARDLNDAIRVASMHPAAHLGADLGWAIEVRPIADACHQ